MKELFKAPSVNKKIRQEWLKRFRGIILQQNSVSVLSEGNSFLTNRLHLINMNRSVVFLLVVVVFSSLQLKAFSQAPNDSGSSRLPSKSGSFDELTVDDFVPDSLTGDEDDSNGVQRADYDTTRGNRNARLKTATKAEQSRRIKAQTPVNGQWKTLGDTSRRVIARATTPTLQNQNMIPKSLNPERRSTSNSQRTSTFVNTVGQPAAPHKQSGTVSEEKLKMTTRKLVKWLRNRLRKRLEDVVSLEEKCDVEQKLLVSLNHTIENEASERRAEIRVKVKTQNEVQNVRQHFHEPELHLQQVRAQNVKLVDQLSHLKETYDELASIRKQLEDKLVSTGFTNWLQKRGKDYMPATAVGVLSKSAKILDPVSRGLGEVVKLDELFSYGVESVIPISERSLLSRVIRDIALVLPVIPVIMLFWRIGQISRRLSVLHLVLYISAILAFESGLMFGISVFTGTEAVLELQKSYELLLVTAVFVDVFLLFSMIFLQVLVTALRSSRSESMQALLSLALGYHFFRAIFQPVALSQPPTVTGLALLMYTVSFILILFEKKAALRLGTRLDKHLNNALLVVERWAAETWDAMKNMFVDTLPDRSDYGDESSFEGHSLSGQTEMNRDFGPINAINDRVSFDGKVDVDVDIEEVTKALNGSLGYAKWNGRRTSNKVPQSKQTFRGIRSYKAHSQPKELLSTDKTA